MSDCPIGRGEAADFLEDQTESGGRPPRLETDTLDFLYGMAMDVLADGLPSIDEDGSSGELDLEVPSSLAFSLGNAIWIGEDSSASGGEVVESENVLSSEAATGYVTAEDNAELTEESSEASDQEPDLQQPQSMNSGAQVARVDSSAQVDRVDSGAQVDHVDSSAQVDRVDSSAQVARVDSSAQVDRVDSGAQVDHVDSSAQVAREQLRQQLSEYSISDAQENIVNIFKCTRCDNYARPPIYQCRKGNLKCLLCSSNRRICRDCGRLRSECSDIPNVAMNRVALQLRFPCRFQTYGCSVFGKVQELEEHEQRNCDFKTTACPYKRLGTCPSWKGTKGDLMPHVISHHMTNLEREHGQAMPLVGQEVELCPIVDVINYEDGSPSRLYMWTFLQSHMNSNFVINLCYQHNDLANIHYVTVQLLGTAQEANKYECEILLVGQDGQKLGYRGICHSIFDEAEQIYRNRDCLYFDGKTAAQFSSVSHGRRRLKLLSKVIEIS